MPLVLDSTPRKPNVMVLANRVQTTPLGGQGNDCAVTGALKKVDGEGGVVGGGI